LSDLHGISSLLATFLALPDYVVFVVLRDLIFAENAGDERASGNHGAVNTREGHNHVPSRTKNSKRSWKFGANWLGHFDFLSARS
jgi:hypothetical protein